MSPSRKPRPPSKPKVRKPHVQQRHGEQRAPLPPPDPALAPDLAERVQRLELAAIAPALELAATVHDLEERVERLECICAAPAVRQSAPAAAERPPSAFPTSTAASLDWITLGTELAGDPHRMALAIRVARAAATGGRSVLRQEEDEIAAWFAAVVDLAIRRGRDRAAASIWFLLVGDWQHDPIAVRPARCPSIGALKLCPGEDGFVEGLLRAAPDYARTVIYGASEAEIEELRQLVRANERALDAFRPFGRSLIHNRPAAEDLEVAREVLTARFLGNVAACHGFQSWAHGMSAAANEHSLPGVDRLGAVAWLAKVALVEEDPIPDPDPKRERERKRLRDLERAVEMAEHAGRGDGGAR